MKVEKELVYIMMDGFSEPWESFVEGVYGYEHMPTFELLDAFIQEKTRRATIAADPKPGPY